MLGNKIKDLRESKKMTQQELADSLDISQSTIGMIEGNKRPAGRKTLIKLSEFFNVSVDYLLSDNTDSNLDKNNDNKFKELDDKFNQNGKLAKEVKEYEYLISKECFDTPEEAMKFILMQPSIMGFGGFDVAKMSADEILDFANELLNQLRLISYKYKK